jgi:protein-S-isoprenylcysteine O-methyltransferase Ste14
MNITNMRPPRIAMALTLIAAAVHWSLNLGERTRFSLPWTGLSIGIAGFFLMMWSWWLFKTQHLAVCLPQKTAHIIKAGPYRFSRNPMYLGMILMLLGLALYVGTLPFYLSAIGYFAILNFFFCPYEENKLANAFGKEYIRYRDRVRRWI